MKKSLGCLAIAALCTMPSLAYAGDLRLSISNGRVTLVAQDVTLKQILDEWGRVGQTIVVGADKLVGPPVTLELHDVAEGRALETLLRSASGYIVKPRVGTFGVSAYDRILIMPASRAPAVSSVPQPFPSRPQPQVVMPNVVDDDMESPTPIMPPGAVPPPGAQQFPGQPSYPGQPPYPVQPPMQPGQVQQPQMTSPTPGQLPPPPNVPGNPYQMMVPPPARPPTAPGSQTPTGGRGGGPGNNQGGGGA